MVLSTTVSGDGKTREMTCLPYRFIFGWLFSISQKNVKESARATIVKFKLECYNALFDHFTEKSSYLEEREQRILKTNERLKEIKSNFRQTKNLLAEAQKEHDEAFSFSFEEWRADNAQLKLDI